MNEVTGIIVNYKTPQLLQEAYGSLVSAYPDLPLILIDNGSKDESVQFIKSVSEERKLNTTVLLPKNVGHGPALHLGICIVETPFVLTMDSDCVVLDSGFIENMLKSMEQQDVYAVGWLRYVNINGVSASGSFDKSKFTPYVHPHLAMFRRSMYLQLRPFDHSGAPATHNMEDAKELGFRVLSFPVDSYVLHRVAGTRRMFGGRWDPKDNETPSAWSATKTYPI